MLVQSRLTLPDAQFLLTALLLTGAIILGGGQGGRGDVIVQELALIVLAVLACRWQLDRRSIAPVRWTFWLVLLPLTLPILQLLPIPAVLWDNNVLRREIAAQLGIAHVGMDPRIGLNPLASERALWSLLPAVAIYWSILWLPPFRQRQLLGVFLVLAALSVVLGFAQLAGGPESGLRFHSPTNLTEAVGFFANRNHFATLLVMALPLAVCGTAWALSEHLIGRKMPPLLIISGAGLALLLILGIALSRSRAGLMFGMIAVLLSVPIILLFKQRRGVRRAFAFIVVGGVLLSIQFALFGILNRLEHDPLEDIRWDFTRITLQAAEQYQPVGSGLGTFRQAYPPFEAADRIGLGSAIVNHAHNDYAELWMEGGWPFAFLLAIGLSGFAGLTVNVWRKQNTASDLDPLLFRSTWIALLLALLHSLGDYPLRTTAVMTVFSMMAAVALAHRQHVGEKNKGRPLESKMRTNER